MDQGEALYARQMQEISVRITAINRITESRKPNNVRTELDNEFLWLQLRMIVELMAFGGITADESRYAALRAEVLKNPDYTRDGKVKKILEALSQVTPHLLPIPLPDTAVRDARGVLHFAAWPDRSDARTVRRDSRAFRGASARGQSVLIDQACRDARAPSSIAREVS